MGDDQSAHVTIAHLDAVRGEMSARIDLHKAEMTGELKALSSKIDASRSAQEVDSIATRGAIERLTTEIKGIATSVDQLEDSDDRAAAVATAFSAFEGKITRRLGLIIAIASAIVAVFAL